MISRFAFSYIIYEASSMFNVVNAQSSEDLSMTCCERTQDGGVCQDVISLNKCDDSYRTNPSKCEATSFCKLGCCIDEATGTYDKNVPQVLCKQGGNIRWTDDPNCNIAGAKLGCCVLGENTRYTTQRQCEILTQQALSNSSVVDWQGDKNELQCFAMSQSQEVGACLTGKIETEQGEINNCKLVTKTECFNLNGDFNKGYLCTSSELNTNCKKTEKTMCVEGKDSVYFQDSCGNRANIYDGSRVNDNEYWNKIFSIEESCNADDDEGNAESKECGNCNRFLGGICSSALEDDFDVQYGDFYCKPTSCQYKGEMYENGESWCVYEGKIDDGDDVVGSRHFKYVCNQGEIQIEPCADYRNEICVQKNTQNININSTNLSVNEDVEFKNANCIANNWRECLALNSQEDGIEKCEDTLNCRIEHVDIAPPGEFNFKVCTPRYPGAFHLTNEGEQKMAEKICGTASQTCTVYYKQTFIGGCECVANCECEDAIFTQKMNDLCRRLGDCGLEVNTEGEYTDNYNVINAPPLLQQYIQKLV